MNEEKRMNLIQLAASLLLEMNSDIEIKQANGDLFDIVIVTYGDKSKCLVKIVDEEIVESGVLYDYLGVLHHQNAQEKLKGCPLCLMKVNEQYLTIDFQVIARDDWGEYEIEKEVNFWRLNNDNMKWLIKNTRQWNHIVTFLGRDVNGVIKSIRLNYDSYHHDVPATIMYIRDLTPDYKMIQQEPSNDDEVREKRDNVHMQKEYPNDMLDDVILEAVKNIYPDAKPWNDLLVDTNKYKALLQKLEQNKLESAQIRILPDVCTFPQDQLVRIGRFEILRFEVDIFVEPAPIDHLYDNEGFEARRPMNDWPNTLDKYSQMLKTLHRVKDVVR